jgi:hypothetical protein
MLFRRPCNSLLQGRCLCGNRFARGNPCRIRIFADSHASTRFKGRRGFALSGEFVEKRARETVQRAPVVNRIGSHSDLHFGRARAFGAVRELAVLGKVSRAQAGLSGRVAAGLSGLIDAVYIYGGV